MKKVIKYKVSGISNTKPEVSKDFTVEEIVEEVPMDDLTVSSVKGNSMTLSEVAMGGATTVKFDDGFRFRQLDVKEATKVRNWLTEFIDSNTSLKVFRDRDNGNYRWFEIPNGNYTFCRSRAQADQEYANDNTVGWSYTRLVDTYGPLTRVDN